MVVLMTDEARTETFDAFFVAEFPRLVSMLTAWSGDRATAEDLAQDALLQAQRRWAEIVRLDNPGTWVRRVALNRSANEGRRRRREHAAMRRLSGAAPEQRYDGAPFHDTQLWERVRALSPNQRDAIVLHYVDDLPLADIANVLGCGIGTVKTHLQRGRRQLATTLEGGLS